MERSNHFFFLLENWARSNQDIDDEPGSQQSHTNTDLKGKTGDDEDMMNNIRMNEEGLGDSPEGLAARKKKLEMAGDEADQSKSDKTESAYMDTQSFFFTLKGGKGNIEDIAKEREFRLNRIRKLHKPMDYKKLKQHELSFMSAILTKRAKKKEEMAIKLKEQQQAYKVSYKSKLHNTFEKDYKGVRHGVQVLHDEHQKHRVMSKKYGEKIKEMNMIQQGDTKQIQQILDNRFPKEGPEMREW